MSEELFGAPAVSRKIREIPRSF